MTFDVHEKQAYLYIILLTFNQIAYANLKVSHQTQTPVQLRETTQLIRGERCDHKRGPVRPNKAHTYLGKHRAARHCPQAWDFKKHSEKVLRQRSSSLGEKTL